MQRVATPDSDTLLFAAHSFGQTPWGGVTSDGQHGGILHSDWSGSTLSDFVAFGSARSVWDLNGHARNSDYDQVTLSPWADGLQAEGRRDQADEMRAISATLADDFRQHGMTDADTQEVMGLAREAMGNSIMPGLPVSDDRLAEMRSAAESFIAENRIGSDDIGLAQRLVRDLDAKTDGRVSEYLIDTGMGNRPETILKAIEIAKRRYGG